MTGLQWVPCIKYLKAVFPTSRTERGRSSGVEHNLAKVGVEGSNPSARSSRPFHTNSPLRGPTSKSAGLPRFWSDTLWCARVERTAVLLSRERILSRPWVLGDLTPRFQCAEIIEFHIAQSVRELASRSGCRWGLGANLRFCRKPLLIAPPTPPETASSTPATSYRPAASPRRWPPRSPVPTASAAGYRRRRSDRSSRPARCR